MVKPSGVGLGLGVCFSQGFKFDYHRYQFRWTSPYRVKTLALNRTPQATGWWDWSSRISRSLGRLPSLKKNGEAK
jgi:hypothetical protein